MKLILNFLLTEMECKMLLPFIEILALAMNDANFAYHMKFMYNQRKDSLYYICYIYFDPYFEITDKMAKSLRDKITNNITVYSLKRTDNMDCLNVIKYLANYPVVYKAQYSHLYIKDDVGEVIDVDFRLPNIKYTIERIPLSQSSLSQSLLSQSSLPEVIEFRDLHLHEKYVYIVFNNSFYDHVKRNNLTHLFEHIIGKDITHTAYANQDGLTYTLGNMGYDCYHQDSKEINKILEKLLTNIYTLRYIDLTLDEQLIKEINHQIERHMNELYNVPVANTEHVYSNYCNNLISLYDIAYMANRDFRIYSFDHKIDTSVIEELERKYPKRVNMVLPKVKIPMVNITNLLKPISYHRVSAKDKQKYLQNCQIVNWLNNREGVSYDATANVEDRSFMICQQNLINKHLIGLLFSYPSFDDLRTLYRIS